MCVGGRMKNDKVADVHENVENIYDTKKRKMCVIIVVPDCHRC